MWVTVDLGQVLQVAANAVVVAGGACGLWVYLKRRWHDPPRK